MAIIAVGPCGIVGYHGAMDSTDHPAFSRPSLPLRQTLFAQLFGAVLVGLVPLFAPGVFPSLLFAALAQGICAALISHFLGGPRWWLPVHAGFLPLAVWLVSLGIAPGWYLAGFVLLMLVYWRTDRSRVPLYLSNRPTAQAVLQLLPAGPCRVIDLGCGHAGLLRHLARARPDSQFSGIEHAPLPWLWARLASADLGNLKIRYGNFWDESLAGYDFVYVFLSPVPMPRLFLQAQQQMPPEALLVSNSFPVPGVQADRRVSLADRRKTQLYCYRPGRLCPSAKK